MRAIRAGREVGRTVCDSRMRPAYPLPAKGQDDAAVLVFIPGRHVLDKGKRAKNKTNYNPLRAIRDVNARGRIKCGEICGQIKSLGA